MANRQQEKSQQTHKELMASAMELFGERGYNLTTVSAITARAGYAKGSFYRHWPGKDDLMFEIIEHKLADYRAARDRRLAETAGLAERLAVIWNFLENIVADRNWSRVFLEFALQASRDPRLKQRMNESAYRLSNQVFADLVRDQVDTDFPPEKIGALNTALFEGFLIHNVLETGVLTLEDVKKAATTLAVINGRQEFKKRLDGV
jgi:AcrR family transcriptional regulator